MSRVLYLESFAGIAGDMFTAAIVDAGLVEAEEIQATPALLGMPNVSVEMSSSKRAGAQFTHLRVVPPPEAPQAPHAHQAPRTPPAQNTADVPGVSDAPNSHHRYGDLVRLLEQASLPSRAKDFALRVFRLLAEAEADAHGTRVEEVSFHEVGAVDSVVDVAMAGVCLARIAPDRILASPVKLGRGKIRIHHGTYPVPPPASARLALGMPVAPVPEAIALDDVELSTPTGLAILKATEAEFVEGWPPGTLLAQGAGAGTRDLGAYPNVFRVALLDDGPRTRPRRDLSPAGQDDTPSAADAQGSSPVGEPGIPLVADLQAASSIEEIHLPFERDRVVEIRCNVDDQTGERTAWVIEKALERGALDAWIVPLIGKKGRPAQSIVLLVPPAEVPGFVDFLLRDTTTYGVRYASWDRFKLSREEAVRQTNRGPVSFSIGTTTEGEKIKEKPEFEDLKKIWDEDPDFRL